MLHLFFLSLSVCPTSVFVCACACVCMHAHVYSSKCRGGEFGISQFSSSNHVVPGMELRVSGTPEELSPASQTTGPWLYRASYLLELAPPEISETVD